MKLLRHALVIAAVLPAPALAVADTYVANVQGACAPGTASYRAVIDFTPTGGNFATHTGTATVKITLENTSGLIPFQSPAVGNPVQTAFYFNVPAGTSVSYTDGTILAGSTVYSTGTNVNGIPAPAYRHAGATSNEPCSA